MIHKNDGFSLVEILVAICITGAIGGVLATSIYQFGVVSSHGTEKLYALDNVQYASRWIIRDAQSAIDAGTLPGDNEHLDLTVPDSSGGVNYDPPNPALGQVFGTLTCINAPHIITYINTDEGLERSVDGGAPFLVARDVEVNFATPEITSVRNRYYITMDMTAPIEHGPDVHQVFHVYLRTTGE